MTYVSSSPYNPAPGIHFYTIYCGLTNEGLKQHQKGEELAYVSASTLSDDSDHCASSSFCVMITVASIAFEYVRLLKSQPFPSWVYKELKQIYNMHFRFLEAHPSVSDDADDISTALHNAWPRSQIFSAPFTFTDDDPAKIKEALGYIAKESAQIFVASNKEIDGLKYDQAEKWYGTQYVVEPLKSAWFEVGNVSMMLAVITHTAAPRTSWRKTISFLFPIRTTLFRAILSFTALAMPRSRFRDLSSSSRQKVSASGSSKMTRASNSIAVEA